MRSIAVFNNKGGVGKSTLTLLLADFFSSTNVTIEDRRARVLVIDLDAQNSSATALVGPALVQRRRRDGKTVDQLLRLLLQGTPPSLQDFLITRHENVTAARKIPLGELWVMATDGDAMVQLEEKYRDRVVIGWFERLRPHLERAFDIVLIDLPANIDRRNFVPMAALSTADFIVTPTEPSKITLNALEKTFDIVRDAQGAARQAGRKEPRLVGLVLNRTDRRTRQYRLHAGDLKIRAGENDSLVFDNWLPPAPALATATDDSLQFESLRDRYDTYYDHVRRVSKELAERCGLVRPASRSTRSKKGS
jgi:chromosome partitioning protein